MQGAVRCGVAAVQGNAVVVGGADGGVRAEAAKRDGEAAIDGQIERAVAFAPVFGEGDIGGRVGLALLCGFKAGGEAGSEEVGGGHGDSVFGAVWQMDE